MKIEDVVLVATVREDIRDHTLKVDVADIPHRVEMMLAGSSSSIEGVNTPLANTWSGPITQEPESTIGARASYNAAAVTHAGSIVAEPPVDPQQATRARGGVDECASDSNPLVSSLVALFRVTT
jgi:hypothetical protein